MRCILCGEKMGKKHTADWCAAIVLAHKLIDTAFSEGTLEGSYSGDSPVHDNPPEKPADTANVNPSAAEPGPAMVVRVRVPRWRIDHG